MSAPPVTIATESCGTCHYFRGGDQCRRFPGFMATSPDQWCGEYRAPEPIRADSMGYAEYLAAFTVKRAAEAAARAAEGYEG